MQPVPFLDPIDELDFHSVLRRHHPSGANVEVYVLCRGQLSHLDLSRRFAYSSVAVVVRVLQVADVVRVFEVAVVVTALQVGFVERHGND